MPTLLCSHLVVDSAVRSSQQNIYIARDVSLLNINTFLFSGKEIWATPIVIRSGCSRASGSLLVVNTCPTMNEDIATYSHLFP
jgi:hypothetical protein